jgi:hypothetical protein
MKHWWVPGLQIGYEHTFVHQAADFLGALTEAKPASPTFREAMATDFVTDAVLRSAKSGRWEEIDGNEQGREWHAASKDAHLSTGYGDAAIQES